MMQSVRPCIRYSKLWSKKSLQPILCRFLQSPSKPADFGFAFDIDGVLMRASDPIPKARETLLDLQSRQIPFILLTNGGGKHEKDRVAELSSRLEVDLDLQMFIQSHSPFEELDHFKDKTVLVMGGDGDRCRQVAESYGYQNAVTPGDILVAHPEIWPFSTPYAEYYKKYARPLPKPVSPKTPAESLKIDAVFVYNDPRDWGLDAQLILDLMLSRDGILGTFSEKNGDTSLANNGYQQDGQPPLYFSNPDLWWAAKFNLPRIGQGAFRESVEGIWAATTGGKAKGVELLKIHIGKPHFLTYRYAERKLLKSVAADSIKRVYMIGDNPESDIRGGSSYDSPEGIKWSTILVRTGVYQGGTPSVEPTHFSKDVYDAVQWAFEQENVES